MNSSVIVVSDYTVIKLCIEPDFSVGFRLSSSAQTDVFS